MEHLRSLLEQVEFILFQHDDLTQDGFSGCKGIIHKIFERGGSRWLPAVVHILFAKEILINAALSFHKKDVFILHE